MLLKNVPDDSSLTILWVRGGKNIDTNRRYAKEGTIKFKEKFMMKTSLEFDTNLAQYVAKPVSRLIELTNNFKEYTRCHAWKRKKD